MFDLFGETEKPLGAEAFTGPTTGLLSAAGQSVARTGVEVFQAATLGVAAVFPEESPEEFERKNALPPDQRGYSGLTQEDFFRFSDERLDPAIKFWSPDPASLTTAGQIVSALAGLPMMMVAGPVGLIATPTMTVGKQLVEQGVDPTTATAAAVGTGAAMGLAVALPAAGQTLKQTLGLMLANPVIGAAQDAATAGYLKSQGYSDQAQMFDPFDPAARSVDAVLGAVFGGLAHYGRVKARMPQEVADAIDTVDAAKQRENLSPFTPDHKGEHQQALGKAMQDLAEGKPVDVSAAIEPTIPKPKAPSYTAARFKDEVQQVFGASPEQSDALLALIDARAKVRGEDADSFINRNIAGVTSAAPEGAVLFQDRPMVQPFYSKVLAEVDGLTQEKWTGEQLLGKLRKTPGVKGEELSWTGLDEFLTGKQSVTRAEVREYLDQNQVKVQEVVKGTPTKDAADRAIMEFRERGRHTGFSRGEVEDLEIDLWKGDLDPANAPAGMQDHARQLVEALRARDTAEGEGTSRSKYDSHVLPGGKNYREMLLTLPDTKTARAKEIVRASSEDFELGEALEKKYGMTYAQALKFADGEGVYRSSHFDEKNILAHIRFNERTGPTGERLLHLEEVQSDWHQQGRSKGYQGEAGPIPDAPFKKNWHELALRRMLRYAAEQGFDRVTWTGGDAQAARYDLSKKLDSLAFEVRGDQYHITGKTKGADAAQDFGTFGEAQLEDAIGKEMAQKIIDQRKDGQTSGSFDAAGLKIGGEGMRGFYDKIVPQFLDKFGRKFGARVEASEIRNAEREQVQKNIESRLKKYHETEDVTMKASWLSDVRDFEKQLKTMPENIGLQSIPITDAMRSALLYEGQPLFQGEKGAVSFLADGRALIHALQAPDFSTLVHEVGHIFEKDLSATERRDFDTWLHSQVPGAKWSTAQRETFARAFERYLAEGQAPMPELQGIFDKFKNWMLAIYQRIAGTAIDVNMNKQLRSVFDRMLFTQALKSDVHPEVKGARSEVARVRAEMEQEGRELLGLAPDSDELLGGMLGRMLAEQESSTLAGFLRSPENVGKALAEMFEAEANALESSSAENLVVDGYQVESMISTAADWYLQANRDARSSGSDIKKPAVVNALRKTARGDFARLTAGQQHMVSAALDAIGRQAQTLAKEVDAQDLKVGDRFTTPELEQRVVVGERGGMLYLDNGQSLDLSGTTRLLGEIDRKGRPDELPQSAAEYYLNEQGDMQLHDGQDAEGNPKTRSARDMLNEAHAELAKSEAQEHLYKRAAFCLNLG